MDIVHIILGKANPERMNGVNKVVYELATKQIEYGLDVSVWGVTGDLKRNFSKRKFETQLFLKCRNPFAIPKKLKEEILRTDAETIFHLHGGWIPFFYSLSRFLSNNQRKFVITPHGAYNTIAMKKSFFLKKIYFQLFEKKVLQRSQKIHSIGKSEEEGLNTIFKTDQSVLIPYGFENHKDSANFFSGNEIIFGFIGRLDIFTKGLDVMIDAFEDFIEEHSNARLWIIGDGKDKQGLQELINSKNLEKNVEILGSKFGKEKSILLQQMDVFLHPSRNEGLPVSILEACAFGKPCIVSSFTNVGEQIEDYNAGIMFSDYHFRAMSRAMKTMYDVWRDKTLFIEISENAQTMVEQEFNWGQILERLNTELYDLKSK